MKTSTNINSIVKLLNFCLQKVELTTISFEVTPKISNNSWYYSTDLAFKLSHLYKEKPLIFANKLFSFLNSKSKLLTELDLLVDLVQPGYLNFSCTTNAWFTTLDYIVNNKKELFGSQITKNFTYNLEFVSANPTGYLHIGNARNAVLGDCLVKIFRFLGYDVTTKYYVNDCGTQIHLLGLTVFMILSLLTDSNFVNDNLYKGKVYWRISATNDSKIFQSVCKCRIWRKTN